MEYWEDSRVPTLAEMKERLADLEKRIAEYPYWGAALSVMDEEARGLRRAIAAAEAK